MSKEGVELNHLLFRRIIVTSIINKENRAMRQRMRRTIVIGMMGILEWNVSEAQDKHSSDQPSTKTAYDKVVVNSDGSLLYVEPLDSTITNRLEYTSMGRPTLDIYYVEGIVQTHVQIIDYNSDFKADFIRIERLSEDRNNDVASFYRGPLHKKHEEGHLDHTLQHRFIRRDSSLTKEIEERLEAMRMRAIREDEIGVFSGYSLFAELNLKDIRDAFVAADAVFKGLSDITSMSLKNVRFASELSVQYKSEIKKLIGINPHTFGGSKE